MDSEKLDSIVNELEQNSKKLKDFTDVYTEISKLQANINSNLDLLATNNKTLENISNVIDNHTKESIKQLKVVNDFLEQKISEFYKDNKAFQKEIDSTISTRLEKHKSDIQVEIRNEGIQLQRVIETSLISKINSMEINIKERFLFQSKELKNLKILIFGLFAISLVVALILFIK